jgi:restriction endonuclease S subunit
MKKLVQLKDICNPVRSSLKNDDLIGHEGDYPVFGAPGEIAKADFYQEENASIGIVKDGSGVGRVMLLPEKSSVLGTIQMVVPKKGTDLLYLFYLLKSMNLSNGASGATIPHIYFKNYGMKQFSIPPLEEQKQIGQELKRIQNTASNGSLLIMYCDEAIKSRFNEMFGDVLTNSKRFPTHSLVEACEVMDGLRKPVNSEAREKMQQGNLFPYYGANGQVGLINGYLSDFDAVALAEDCGSYGPNEATSYIIKGKAWVNNHAHLLKPIDGIATLEYLNAYFYYFDFRKLIGGTTRQKLTQGTMKNIPIVCPPIAMQKEYSAFTKRADKLKFDIQKEIDLANELLTLKFHEYFDQEA